MHIDIKRTELESPGWTRFVANSKPDQPGLSCAICLEVVMERS